MAADEAAGREASDSGVVSSHATNLIEPPELVADRIIRFARIVGRENVIAGTDCGLGGRVHQQIAWKKLAALSEGAGLASKELWQNAGSAEDEACRIPAPPCSGGRPYSILTDQFGLGKLRRMGMRQSQALSLLAVRDRERAEPAGPSRFRSFQSSARNQAKPIKSSDPAFVIAIGITAENVIKHRFEDHIDFSWTVDTTTPVGFGFDLRGRRE